MDKPLEYKGGCNLQCNSTEKAITSDSSIATIIDNTKAVNEILSLVSGSPYPLARYASIPVTYSIYNDGDGGMYHLVMRGAVATEGGSDEEYHLASKDAILDILLGYGIALVDSNKDASFEIRITRNEQVGYSQGANSGNTKGSLLPIFCI